MPRPRRTLRQCYFGFRSRLRDSKLPGSMWAFLVLAILVAILWGLARLLGLPIEHWVRTGLAISA